MPPITFPVPDQTDLHLLCRYTHTITCQRSWIVELICGRWKPIQLVTRILLMSVHNLLRVTIKWPCRKHKYLACGTVTQNGHPYSNCKYCYWFLLQGDQILFLSLQAAAQFEIDALHCNFDCYRSPRTSHSQQATSEPLRDT